MWNRLFLSGALACLSLAATQPDVPGYRNLRWGMTLQEVKKALGTDLGYDWPNGVEFDSSTSGSKKPNGRVRVTIKEFPFLDSSLQGFVFCDDKDRLCSIYLRAFAKDHFHAPIGGSLFNKMEASLKGKYGKPTFRKTSALFSDPANFNGSAKWVFKTTTITLLYSGGFLDLHYEPTGKIDNSKL